MTAKVLSSQFLEYIEKVLTEDNGRLYWRWDDNQSRGWNNKLAYKEAGCSNKKGYRVVCFQPNDRNDIKKPKSICTSRIIFYMHHSWMPEFVDNINGDMSDNRIENLRSKTQAQKTAQCKNAINNTSGHRGVRVNKNSYRARIKYKNKEHNLGAFYLKADAIAARENAAKECYGVFRSPSDRTIIS